MQAFISVIFIIASFTVTYGNSVKWRDDRQVYVEDYYKGTQRIIGFNEKSKKAYPVYNGEGKEKELCCFISFDGRFLAVTKRAANTIELYKDKRKIYESSFETIKQQKDNRELIEKSFANTEDPEFIRIYHTDEDSIVLCPIRRTPFDLQVDSLIKLNYKSNKIAKVTKISRIISGRYQPFLVSLSHAGIPVFIIYSLFEYYDIPSGEIRNFLPEKFEREKSENRLSVLYCIFGDKAYFNWDDKITEYDVKTQKLNMLNLPVNNVKAEYRKVAVTKKYIYIAGFKDYEKKKALYEKLYRTDDKTEVKCPLFKTLRSKGWEISSFSPSGNRILVQDIKHNNTYFFDLPE